MKAKPIYFILISFCFIIISFYAPAQENWLPHDEYISIQQQSLDAIESYGELLNDIVAEAQSGGISLYYYEGDLQQIFQDGSVPVSNDINPKAKTFLPTDIKSYLNYWFTHVDGKMKKGEVISVEFQNVYVSPVFIENKIAFSKVYFEKHITSNGNTVKLNEYAIIRSAQQANEWRSLISGIDLLEDKVKLDENSTTKELQSVRSDLGVLTETIKQDSTIISYKNFSLDITPAYSRTNFADKYNSVYYYDQNLYQCVINDYKVSLKKDSISVFSPGVETYFNSSGFNIHNSQTGFHSKLTGEKNLTIEFPGCYPFIMNEETVTITNNNHIVIKSSPNSDHIDFANASENLISMHYSDQMLEVNYSDYQMGFLLTEDEINLNYRNYTKDKTIYASNTKLVNMELISIKGEFSINDFYIDKNEVSLAEFKRFVEEAGYVTEVEKRGWSYIVDGNFKSSRKYSPSGDKGLSNSLDLEKGFGVNWKCNEFGEMLHLQSQDTNRPVVHVSYYDALHYCNWAGKQLPSRDEMLYAAGSLISNGDLNNYVMYANTSGGKINRVKQKLETNEHIWDILGNVYEWCNDWMCDDKNNTMCLQKHVFGGYWYSQSEELKINREKEVASHGSGLIGFRGVIRNTDTDQ